MDLLRVYRELRKLLNIFGVWHSKKGSDCPIARVSQMFDVLNNLSIDAIISPKSVGECELAAQHFLNPPPDRSYLTRPWLSSILAFQSDPFFRFQFLRKDFLHQMENP